MQIAITRASCIEMSSIFLSSQSKCLFIVRPCGLTHFIDLFWYNRTEFLITTSIDGHVKLWKKQDQGIEFVKHYRAHLAQIVAVSASADGQLFASVAEDGSAKVFDVVNFGKSCPSRTGKYGSRNIDCDSIGDADIINMMKLGYTPHACCWVHRRGQAQGLLAMYVPYF